MSNVGKIYEVTIVNNGFMVISEQDHEVHVFTCYYTLANFFDNNGLLETITDLFRI